MNINYRWTFSHFENIQTEDGNNIVPTDPFHGTQGETEILLEDGGLVLTEDQPSETEGFDFELLLLEETNGMRPVYLAMEDSMTDEVIVATEIQIIPKGSQEVGSQVFKRESTVVPPQVDPDEGGYLLEQAIVIVHNVLMEDGFSLLQEDDTSLISLENSTSIGDRFASEEGSDQSCFHCNDR